MTDYYQREPHGAGFTAPGETDKEFIRGAGNPITEYTQESSNAVTYDQVDPPRGFGYMPFGDNDPEFGRGFGQPTTQYTEDNDD